MRSPVPNPAERWSPIDRRAQHETAIALGEWRYVCTRTREADPEGALARITRTGITSKLAPRGPA